MHKHHFGDICAQKAIPNLEAEWLTGVPTFSLRRWGQMRGFWRSETILIRDVEIWMRHTAKLHLDSSSIIRPTKKCMLSKAEYHRIVLKSCMQLCHCVEQLFRSIIKVSNPELHVVVEYWTVAKTTVLISLILDVHQAHQTPRTSNSGL